MSAFDTLNLLSRIHEADITVAASVGEALPGIAKAVDAIAGRLDTGGRWFYTGAGTSGRLGALDAAEIPPTFGTDPGLVVALLAGGPRAMLESVEGAEDDEQGGGRDLAAAGMTSRDAVVGLSASGTTPYVRGAIRFARAAGALTVAVVCRPKTPLLALAEIPIFLDVGPEVISGSTRLKAGTAQKMALNMLSTAVMARRGLVFQGEMVAMKPTNEKLRRRAVGIVSRLARKTQEDAERLLRTCGWDLPAALVSGRWSIDDAAARSHLSKKGSHVARALTEPPEEEKA
jgi:N-acetylmuramic acid 6-phosphate etherase